MNATPTKNTIRRKAVITDLTKHSTNFESLYPREGFVRVDGQIKPVFLGHPDARCDCEFKFSNERKHPRSSQVAGAVVLCGGHLMKLTDRKAP